MRVTSQLVQRLSQTANKLPSQPIRAVVRTEAQNPNIVHVFNLETGQCWGRGHNVNMLAAISQWLGAFLDPTFQPATVFLQQKAAHAKALAENAVRLRVAGCSGNPLSAHIILAASEPLLRQHFQQSCP